MTGAVRVQPWHLPMRGRDPDEEHRASTPLELLFDLCFVVAVAQASIALHHAIADERLLEGTTGFLMAFFAIWWAWMNFTWFASAFDTDDVLYRLLTFVQIAGVLVIAAGIEKAFAELDYTTVTIGYAIMRIGLVAQWLRVVIEHPEMRPAAGRFALGIGVLQIGWLARLAMPAPIGYAGFLVLVVLELLVPVWAERAGRHTPYHRGHIAERYGLFTIIVLGESVLAASTALQEAVTAGGLSMGLIVLGIGGLVLIGAMWWVYFKHDVTQTRRLELHPFIWGYGHYAIFVSVAAVGAALQVAADISHEEAAISPMAAALSVAVPVAIYLVAAWAVSGYSRQRGVLAPVLLAAAAVLAVAMLAGSASPPIAVLGMGIVVASLVGYSLIREARLASVGAAQAS